MATKFFRVAPRSGEDSVNIVNAERRYIRIEDWEGNIYYPESGGSSTGGSIVDSSDASSTGTTTTDGQSTDDSQANNGTAIVVVADATEDQNIITTNFDNLSFGKISGNVRLKSSIGSGDTVLIVINCYYFDNTNQEDNYMGTLISSTEITGNKIGVVNDYVDIGFVTNFKGISTSSVSLKVEVLLKAGTGCTVHLDQIAVTKSFAGVTGTATKYI